MKATNVKAGMIVRIAHHDCRDLRVLSTNTTPSGKVELQLESMPTKVDLASGSVRMEPAEVIRPVECDPNWDIYVLSEDV